MEDAAGLTGFGFSATGTVSDVLLERNSTNGTFAIYGARAVIQRMFASKNTGMRSSVTENASLAVRDGQFIVDGSNPDTGLFSNSTTTSAQLSSLV